MKKIFFAAFFAAVLIQSQFYCMAGSGASGGVKNAADTDYSIAYVNDFSGECEIRRSGEDFSEAVQDLYVPLYEGDTVSTDSDSSMEVVFDDATVVKLDPGSRLLIKNLKGKNSSRTGLELLKGRLMAVVKKLFGKEEFTVKTKMAMAAVKGTEFIVQAGDDSSIGVYNGAVEVSGLDMEGNVLHRVVLKKGEETTIIKYMHGPGRITELGSGFIAKYREIADLRQKIEYMRAMRGSGKIKKYKIERRLKRIEALKKMKKMDPEKFNSLSAGDRALADEIIKEEPYLDAEKQSENNNDEQSGRDARLKAILEKNRQQQPGDGQ
jgi:hypothetical protein